MAWMQVRGIQHILIQPGKPTQNAFIEGLNENWFESLTQTREAISLWRQDYNEVRPHGTIGRMPPTAFTAKNRNRNPTTFNAGLANLQTLGPLSN